MTEEKIIEDKKEEIMEPQVMPKEDKEIKVNLSEMYEKHSQQIDEINRRLYEIQAEKEKKDVVNDEDKVLKI